MQYNKLVHNLREITYHGSLKERKKIDTNKNADRAYIKLRKKEKSNPKCQQKYSAVN